MERAGPSMDSLRILGWLVGFTKLVCRITFALAISCLVEIFFSSTIRCFVETFGLVPFTFRVTRVSCFLQWATAFFGETPTPSRENHGVLFFVDRIVSST